MMNAIRRRLLRVYAESGGDLDDEAEVRRFLDRVEALMDILPPRVRETVEIAWQAPETPTYDRMARELAARRGEAVSVVALRQRVSRGLRALERTIRVGREDTELDRLARR